ncbi:MAG: NAD-dependent epimerase/dehydratase family protein, partial [Desulfocapsaceae bacterium]|nr:NAD-dependent epimerase/dehydratase family protein [Desulfocapsaceae bacterium]
DINGNLLSSVRLLQQMRDQGVSRLVFLSSGGTVYGETQSIPIPEEHERNPVSSYGIVKVAIENYIAMFSAQHGLQSLVLRVSNPYGPRQGHLGVQGVIPTFFQRIITGDEIRIWGDGSSVRDYLYVSDLVSFVVGGINEDLSGVYNVGSGQGVSLKDVLSLIEEISGVSANVKYLSPRGFDVKKVVLDISKARKALDWEPLVPLREGCERYWKWAKG